MDKNGIFQVLFATIKAKATTIVTKIKLWTSWNFIKTRVVASLRGCLEKVLDVKPKHKKDYYEVFGWLISKRLAFAIVVVIGILSVIYLINLRAIFSGNNGEPGENLKTYKYSSPFLCLAEGTVRITGKGGYLAYEGAVEKGYVTGEGRLYNRDQILVYQGNFEQNCYEGMGTQYYGSGMIHYDGEFSKNIYEGTGKLYRDNGTLCYYGEFIQGLKEGDGTLYDNGGNVVYEGTFLKDQLVYSEFLGKKTSEAAETYKGERVLYTDADYFAVSMRDIDAVYIGYSESNTLDQEIQIESIYVLQDFFFNGTSKIGTINELNEYFENKVYEGNSLIIMPEAVCFYELPNTKVVTEMDLSSEYDDYYEVNSFQDQMEVYLYSYEKDGLIYTFVCTDEGAGFSFYSIMKAEKGAEL